MNNKGVALLTVLLVMIIGLGLTAITTLLVVRGYQTSRAAKNYQIALQMAQGGIEEAIRDLKYNLNYVSAQNFKNFLLKLLWIWFLISLNIQNIQICLTIAFSGPGMD